jgi:hypothetical protein
MLESARRAAVGADAGPDVLRRAVSTIYYAVFHFVAQSAADCFVGRANVQTARYAMIYRAFEHTHLRRICLDLSKPTPSEKVRRSLGRSYASEGIRRFAEILPDLQEDRHLADYHPTQTFEPNDVASLVAAAETAIAAFSNADPEERADVLALMMLRPRD